MFEVFDYRDGTPLFFTTYENTARLFVNYVNKHHGGRLDYDKHIHAEHVEEATGPTKNGVLFVTIKCECGHTVRTYVDSVL